MELIPISYDCPKNIQYVVRWVKGLIKFQELDPTADRDKMLLILHESVNSPHWPPNAVFSIKMTKARVAVIYDRACEWIFSKETF